MSVHSGYDALYSELTKYQSLDIDSVFGNHQKIYKRGLGRILSCLDDLAGGSSFYNAQSATSEIKFLMKAKINHYDILHYTYGEPYFGFGSNIKFNKAKLVVTNHQPISWWKKNEPLINKFCKADEIILLSDYDKSFFDSKNIKAKSHFIPHGIDTLHYLPNKIKVENDLFNILFSGRYLRDLEMLSKVVIAFSKTKFNIHFNIIHTKKADFCDSLKQISNFQNVSWFSNLPDQEYLKVYQNSDCLFLPLIDCTANNALLEAMSCGLPIITNNLPAIKSYVDDNVAILVDGKNEDDFVDAIKKLYLNYNLCRQMGIEGRKRAVHDFDWNVVAKKTLEIFKS